MVHARRVQPFSYYVLKGLLGAREGLEVEPEEVRRVNEATVVEVMHIASEHFEEGRWLIQQSE